MGIELAVGAIASGFAAGSSFAAGVLSIGFSFTAAATSLALGGLQSLLSPKPKNNLQGANIKSGGITQNVRQPISSRRTIYGELRVGGDITFMETSSSDKYLHIVLTLADHEVEEIGEIWFDDVSIPVDALDGSGFVTSGTYEDLVRIKKYLGTTTQTADADIVSETSVDSNFRGRGVAYIYVRLEYDRDIFPGKIPVITAFVKGKKLYDTRDAGTRFTCNTVLMANDYLTEPADSLTPGIGVDQSLVDSTACNAAANICDEMVTTTNLDDTILSAVASSDIITLTGVNSRLQYQLGDRVTLIGGSLPGGLSAATNYFVIPYQRKGTVRIKLATTLANALAGTAINITSTGTGTIRKNAEPRYYGGGIISTADPPNQNLTDICSAFGNNPAYIGGKWHIKAAAYSSPVFSFNESHIISNIVTRTKVSRSDRFNLVKGVYVSPLNDGQTSDYPPISNSTYATADGLTIPVDYDLPFTQRAHTAQRLAKIKLERHRQELFFEAEFKLHAMQVQPGDTVYISNTRKGWSNKVFEVVKWTLASRMVGNVPLYYVKMALQETASASYDWNNGEETAVDPAPNTNLPNPLVVNPPTGLAVMPVEIGTLNGDQTYEFIISWTPPTDIFVVNGGWYNIEFKKSSQSTWRRSFRAEDSDTEITVKQVQPGVSYDVRIQSVNNLGVRSSFQQLLGFTVSSPSGATIRLDYGEITGTVVESIDLGLITDAASTSEDWGSVT